MSAGPEPDHGRRHPDGRELETEADESRAVAPEVAPDILEQIVAQTASSLAWAEDADPALKAAMLNVARAHAGQPLMVDGAGTALLAAVLGAQFTILARRPALLAQAARAVAGSLLADPAARMRVEHLWAQLQEEAA